MLIISLIAVCVAGALGAASADDGEQALPESLTTTLEPGFNTIGWVAESLPVEDLFAELPQVELVYSWEAGARGYELAAPRLPQRFWTLRYLEPGRAYILRVGGREAVDWRRLVLPARGLVKLRTGLNWTAWPGPDGWRIEEVARGIGSSLQSIRLGSLIYDPSRPESGSDWPSVKRGDALEVRVSRDINWLQPTFVVPELLFTGNPTAEVRQEIERDLADVLAYSAAEFGIWADPSSLLIVISDSAREAFERLPDPGDESDWERFESLWQRSGGWYTAALNSIQLKTNYWSKLRRVGYGAGRDLLLHEYYHAMQDQMSDGGSKRAPFWLIEGPAVWLQADLRTRDRSGNPLSQLLTDNRNKAAFAPTLESTERGPNSWQYDLGLLAADFLIEELGIDALRDYLQALAPNRTGRNGVWESNLSGAGAFAHTFGRTIQDFYAEFEDQMAIWRGSEPIRPQPDHVTLRGGITYGDGVPAQGTWLRIEQVADGQPTGYERRATSDSDGGFELFVHQDADYRIEVRLADRKGCAYWWSEGVAGGSDSAEDAEFVSVRKDDPCARVSATLIDSAGTPIVNRSVIAETGDRSLRQFTDSEDRALFALRDAEQVALSAWIDGCVVYYRPGGMTPHLRDRTHVTISERGITNVVLRLQPQMCTLRISGRFLNADGSPRTDTWVGASGSSGRGGAWPADDGSFSFLVPEAASYDLWVTVDGCAIYYAGKGAAGDKSQSRTLHLSRSDITDIEFRLPEEPASVCR